MGHSIHMTNANMRPLLKVPIRKRASITDVKREMYETRVSGGLGLFYMLVVAYPLFVGDVCLCRSSFHLSKDLDRLYFISLDRVHTLT